MGDKTQLLSLLLVARYRRPWVILSGVLVATLLNHTLASTLGVFIASQMSPLTLRWLLAVTFFTFALWILIPDKEGELKSQSSHSLFFVTVVAFFLAEMGDKTQLATVALAATYANVWLVTLGSTLGMLGSNAVAIFLGEKLLRRIPMKWIRVIASLLFACFGIAILLH